MNPMLHIFQFTIQMLATSTLDGWSYEIYHNSNHLQQQLLEHYEVDRNKLPHFGLVDIAEIKPQYRFQECRLSSKIASS